MARMCDCRDEHNGQLLPAKERWQGDLLNRVAAEQMEDFSAGKVFAADEDVAYVGDRDDIADVALASGSGWRRASASSNRSSQSSTSLSRTAVPDPPGTREDRVVGCASRRWSARSPAGARRARRVRGPPSRWRLTGCSGVGAGSVCFGVHAEQVHQRRRAAPRAVEDPLRRARTEH